MLTELLRDRRIAESHYGPFTVFGTRTIRRKLQVSLAVVCLILAIMSISGIWGLTSYRSVVRNLEVTIDQSPHHAKLVATITQLFEPLLVPATTDEMRVRQQEHFQKQIEVTRGELTAFALRLNSMPLSEAQDGQRPVTNAILVQLQQGEHYSLYDLTLKQQELTDPERHDAVVAELIRSVALMEVNAQLIPDPISGISKTLDDARTDYRRSLTLVWVTSIAALILFSGLIHTAHRGIFKPVTLLHQGARRVARGDFDYRVRLSTNDEMAELADSFNQMTQRFQEIARDLETQVNERSRQLVRSERLAGVGFLAAGVAHEINNPLSAISMAAESLESRLLDLLNQADPDDAKIVRQYLSMMQTEAERCRQITARLLDFSRGRDSTRTQTDVTHVVEEVVSMVQFLSKYRDKKIEFARTSSCYAEINGPEIKQVVLNLVANGLDAMDSGQTMRIEVAEQTDRVCLKFIDEGCGMTSDTIDNIFEPFFTQKKVGQGTGLGLSISHRIVAEHGGTISVTSAGPGKGSTFTVRLPRQAKQVAAA